jgi:signal transduction histidine kinase
MRPRTAGEIRDLAGLTALPRLSLAGDMSLTTPKRTLSFQDDRPLSFQGHRLLEGVARQVVSDINRFFSKDRLQRAAMQDERMRLARELHDGVLQSLTGAALQLEALSRLVEENPQAARQRLRDIEELIAEEQRELRTWIQKLTPAAVTSMASDADLVAALEKLCQRVQRHWGLQAVLTMVGRGAIPRTLGDEIYRLVQEALTNVARHAVAALARVELKITPDRVYITVTDDGRGFPFCGRYDLATLTDGQLGPLSLKERVTSLRGELVLTSTLTGSRLEISLPVDQRRMPGGVSPRRTERP